MIHSRPPGPLLWILIVGGAGFASGFFGPMLFIPEANQGPLVGILLTGPGGALGGLVLYLISRSLGLTAPKQWRLLWGAGAALVVVTLFYCQPEPALRGTLIEAQVIGCGAPAEKVEAAIDDWKKRIAAVTWAPPRPGWQDEARQSAGRDMGLVLDVQVIRANQVFERRKPWDKGRRMAKGWRPGNERKSFYVGPSAASCADYPAEKTAVYFSAYNVSGLNNPHPDWPARKLPDFLGLQVLDTVPVEFREFVGR